MTWRNRPITHLPRVEPVTRSRHYGGFLLAGLAALVLFADYNNALASYGKDVTFLLNDYRVIIGLFIGGALPFFIGALTMTSVGRAAGTTLYWQRAFQGHVSAVYRGTFGGGPPSS